MLLQGKNNWVTKIRIALFRFGLGYVWQNEGVQEVNFVYTLSFRQRLGRSGRIELMQVIDLIFTVSLRRIIIRNSLF